jgi:hypothetical protein
VQTPRHIVFGAVHCVKLQQASPAPPQGAQAPPEHTAPGAVHELPVQQGCVTPPHAPQLPWLQAIAFGHIEPCPTQLPVTQHPPALQALPLQHGSPGPPQCRQKPPEQALSAAEQSEPAQQFWPSAPQTMHVFPEQKAFASHMEPLQHASPGAPQGPASGVAPPVPVLPPVPVAPPTPLVAPLDPVTPLVLDVAPVVVERPPAPVPVPPPAPDVLETSVPASIGGAAGSGSLPHPSATTIHDTQKQRRKAQLALHRSLPQFRSPKNLPFYLKWVRRFTRRLHSRPCLRVRGGSEVGGIVAGSD